MMATNGNKCVQAEGICEIYIARNKSVNKNIYTASGLVVWTCMYTCTYLYLITCQLYVNI